MPSTKEVLTSIYIVSALEYQPTDRETVGTTTKEHLAQFLHFDQSRLDEAVAEAKLNDWVASAENGIVRLTQAGRSKIKVVMLGGSFDVIHPGHVETLEQAKRLGDVLVVTVARDAVFEKNKKRKAMHDEQMRRRLVSAIRYVDAAVLGSDTDPFGSLSLGPDIVALGYDQENMAVAIRSEIKRRNLKIQVVMLKSSTPLIKTSRILSENKSAFNEF